MRSAVLNEIENLISEMADTVRDTGLKDASISPNNITEESDQQELLEAIDWLIQIRDTKFQDVRVLLARHPEHWWRNAKELGYTNLPEMKLLKKKRQALRKAWMADRPEVLWKPKAGRGGKTNA